MSMGLFHGSGRLGTWVTPIIIANSPVQARRILLLGLQHFTAPRYVILNTQAHLKVKLLNYYEKTITFYVRRTPIRFYSTGGNTQPK